MQLPDPLTIRLLASLLAGAAVFMAAVLLWNRGRWWFVNILAQDEPGVAAIGAIVVGLFWGSPVMFVGVGIIGVAAVARYTALLDFDEVV